MRKVDVVFVCRYVTWWRAGNSNVKLPLCLDGRLRNGRRHCSSDEAALTCKSHSHIVCECSIPWSTNNSHQVKWTFSVGRTRMVSLTFMTWFDFIWKGVMAWSLGRVGKCKSLSSSSNFPLAGFDDPSRFPILLNDPLCRRVVCQIAFRYLFSISGNVFEVYSSSKEDRRCVKRGRSTVISSPLSKSPSSPFGSRIAGRGPFLEEI